MRSLTSRMAKAFALAAVPTMLLACGPEPEVIAAGPRVPVTEFVFPNEHERLMTPAIQPSFERSSRWSAEDVAPFWRSPRTLGIRWIEEKSNKTIEELLETIP